MIGVEDISVPHKEKRLIKKNGENVCLCVLHHAVHNCIRFSLGGTLLSPLPTKIASNGNDAKVRVRRNVFGAKGLWTFRPTSMGRKHLWANRLCGEMSIHGAKRL